MEDDLNCLENGRRPQFFGNMKDDINFFCKYTSMSFENEDDHSFLQGSFEGENR